MNRAIHPSYVAFKAFAVHKMGISCFRNSMVTHETENMNASASEMGNAAQSPMAPKNFGRRITKGSQKIR